MNITSTHRTRTKKTRSSCGRRWIHAVGGVALLSTASVVSAIGAFPVTIDVADLDGANGFSISPTGDTPHLGRTVSGAGDFNGDGIKDVIIADPGAARPPGGFAKGQAYILFGTKAGFPANIDVSTLDGANGFAATGTIQLAESVSNAGDINNDGIDDIIISERVALNRRGRAFVIYGINTASAGSFPPNIGLPTDLNGSNGFEIRGVDDGDLAGASVSVAGDTNGDGIDDLIIGATQDALGGFPSGTGAAFVVFGRDTNQAGEFPSIFELSDLDGGNGFRLDGVNTSDRTGWHVSSAGDANGDDISDVIIGTGFQERTYVVFGRGRGNFPPSLNLSSLNGANGFVIIGDSADSIGSAGDVNDDGLDDLILGKSSNSSLELGRAYIIYGRDVTNSGDFAASFDLNGLNGTNGFKIIGVPPVSIDGTGLSVAGAGDLNNDSIDDISIKNGPFGQDETYVVYGRNTANTREFPTRFYLTDLDGDNGFVIQGTGDTTFGPGGPRVAKAGDVNDDGIDDLVIGSGEQTAYVVFGRGADTTAMVQCPGDINHDGIADIAVVTADGSTWIKGLDGGLVNRFNLTDINAVVDVETMPNINANGSPELVVLGTGSVQAEVWDTLTAAQLSLVGFNPAYKPLDLELVDDQTGNSVPELANLAQGSVKVEVKDGLNGDPVNTVSFNNYFIPVDLEIYPDTNGNSAPELAVLGDNKEPAKGDKIEVRDLATGKTVRNIWLGKGWQVLNQELVADFNGNGADEVAVLRVRSSDNAVNVSFRDTRTGKSLGSIGFDRNYPPTELLTIADINGNGSDEVVVFGQRFNGGNQKAQIKDSKTKALIKAVFFDKNFPGQDITTCADINGNGADELVLLGKRASDGKLRAIVKDAKTGALIGTVNF